MKYSFRISEEKETKKESEFEHFKD